MTKEIPKANAATPKLSFGSSSPVPSPAGAVKVASTLKKGSVMDILGKSPANGGITVAAELKTGSVMDILGGKKSTENVIILLSGFCSLSKVISSDLKA